MKLLHRPFARLSTALMRLVGGESAAGILLIVIAIAALAVANSPLAEGYNWLFHHRLGWTPNLPLG